jgi:AcrR family transcriptional regulator
MPTPTFKNLTSEKKGRILASAYKEFSRTSISKALISNIVQEANIARGSFYQYFVSLEDLFGEVLNHLYGKKTRGLDAFLGSYNGDVFQALKAKFASILEQTSGESAQFKANIYSLLISSKGEDISGVITDMKMKISYQHFSDNYFRFDYAQELFKIIHMINLECLKKYLVNGEKRENVGNEYNRYLDAITLAIRAIKGAF